MTKKTRNVRRVHLYGKHSIMSFVLLFALILTGISPINAVAKSGTLEKRNISNEVRKYSEYDISGYTPIYTIADLAGINNNPDGDYVLMNDIDMTQETSEGGSWDSGHGWTPLDTFSGTLDGNGHRITGMNIYGAFKGNGHDDIEVGLFKRNKGTIRRLGLINVNINVYLEENSRGYSFAGGIAGSNNQGTISECYVDGVIYAERYYTGGITGYNFYGKIFNSYNVARVSGNGIIGRAEDGVTYCSSCYNVGEVDGYPIYSKTKGFGDGSNYALKGKSLDAEDIKMLTETQMCTQNMYTGFDFDNTWEIDPNSTYLYPQLKANRHQRVDSFEIVTLPDKTTYNKGEKIDLSGGTAKIIYEDGYSTTVVITNDMLNEYDTTKIGEQDIFIEYGGQKTSFQITVTDIGVKSIKITGNRDSLTKGESMQLKAVLQPDDATDLIVEWSSSNTEVATVDNNGKVTGCAAGQTKIMASVGKVTTTCDIIVKRKMKDFRIEGVIDKEYTGDEIRQEIKVTDGSIVLDKDTDYEINYTNNIEVGTATISVTGLGYYEGSIENDFKISKKASSNVAEEKPSISSGSAKPSQKPSVSSESAKPSQRPSISSESVEPSKKPSVSSESVKPSQKPSISSESAEPNKKPSSVIPTTTPVNDSDMSNIDTDFWDEDSNTGSSVYDTELPVPEIKEVSNGNKMVNIEWSCSDTSDIDGYNIYRSKDGKSWNKIATINDTEIEDYEDRDISNGNGYGYIIRSYVEDSESEISIPEYTYYLNKVNVKSVKSKAAKKLTVKWSKNEKASGYQIRISTTKSFTKATTELKKVDSKKKSTKTIGKLKGGKKYFVQIRAYRSYNGEIYYSEWSTSKSVKAKK